MKLDDFITKMYDSGWLATHDAQHSKIEALWRELFPVVAELEDELEQLKLDMVRDS